MSSIKRDVKKKAPLILREMAMFQQLVRGYLFEVLARTGKCADREAAINYRYRRAARFGNMYRVQQHLFIGTKRNPEQNSAGISASLPNVALNGLGSSGVILALKDVSTFH